MAEVRKGGFWYKIFRRYVDWSTRRSYFSIDIDGSLPKVDGAMIIAPNHTGTLLDALVVLLLRRGDVAFAARADIFRKPLAAKLLNYIKMMPVARERDGYGAVVKNLELMPKMVGLMGTGMPFCIFPEGRHRPMHSLLPIRKGTSRLALMSQEKQPTFIVPVGIDYSDFFRFRARCRVKIGEPIDVGRWVSGHQGVHPSESARLLGLEISERIKQLILYIPDDDNYDRAFDAARPVLPRCWWEWPAAVLSAPFFAASAVLTLPLWATAECICRKIADKAFSNSVRYLLRLFGGPILFLILAVLGFVFLPPLAACGVLLYYCLSYNIFYDWLNLVRGGRRKF